MRLSVEATRMARQLVRHSRAEGGPPAHHGGHEEEAHAHAEDGDVRHRVQPRHPRLVHQRVGRDGEPGDERPARPRADQPARAGGALPAAVSPRGGRPREVMMPTMPATTSSTPSAPSGEGRSSRKKNAASGTSATPEAARDRVDEGELARAIGAPEHVEVDRVNDAGRDEEGPGGAGHALRAARTPSPPAGAPAWPARPRTRGRRAGPAPASSARSTTRGWPPRRGRGAARRCASATVYRTACAAAEHFAWGFTRAGHPV